MKISFVGDIMLGRFVGEKYATQAYQVLSPGILSLLEQSEYRIANLESPVVDVLSTDSLKFSANPSLLSQFKWVSCFSLSNNHINDFGTAGMWQTISHLKENSINYNGLFSNTYEPFLIDDGVNKVAIVMCADMMNYEFDENCIYKTIRIDDLLLNEVIIKYKGLGYLVILYAHVGILFTRYPNPLIRDFVHQQVDNGVDCIITVHSHVLGGMESYKGVPIFYSLGDFLMDGASFRRRKSCVLNLTIIDNRIVNWDITPTITDLDFQVKIADDRLQKEILKSFNMVSLRMQDYNFDYNSFYKFQYKKELLYHSMSTLKYTYNTKGIYGLLKILGVRFYDVLAMIRRMCTDRSKMRYDSDAVSKKHKLSNEDIK